MAWSFRCLPLLILGLFFLLNCGDPIERREVNDYRARNKYVEKQELVTQTAFLVIEIDGKLRYNFKDELEDGTYASGFLISRKRGLFKTAYHFSSLLGENGLDWCRLFINGRVYRAGLYRASPNVDSAVLRIIDKFDPANLPEAPPIASRKVRVGDKVFIEGHHPHPYNIRLKDIEAGKKFQLIPLMKNYYRTVSPDKEDYTEVVYEVLEAEVIAVDQTIKLENNDSELARSIHKFIVIKTRYNHFLNFGGLSGTVVKNDRGEVIGEHTGSVHGLSENREVYVSPIEFVIDDIKDLLDNYR